MTAARRTGHVRFRSPQRPGLRDRAATVFLVSDSLDAIADTCTRAVWLEAGQVRMDAGAAVVVDAYRKAAQS